MLLHALDHAYVARIRVPDGMCHQFEERCENLTFSARIWLADEVALLLRQEVVRVAL